MLFTEKEEKAFCVLEYAQIQLNMTVLRALVNSHQLHQLQCKFGHDTNGSQRKDVCTEYKTLKLRLDACRLTGRAHIENL